MKYLFILLLLGCTFEPAPQKVQAQEACEQICLASDMSYSFVRGPVGCGGFGKTIYNTCYCQRNIDNFSSTQVEDQ